MIAGAAGCRRYRPGKAQIDKVQTVDKGIDDSGKTIRSDIIIDAGQAAGSPGLGQFLR